MGSASSRGQEGVYMRNWQERKPPSGYRKSKGEGVGSGRETHQLLRCSSFSAARLSHLTGGSSVLLQVTLHKLGAFQDTRVQSAWDRGSTDNQKYLSPPLLQAPQQHLSPESEVLPWEPFLPGEWWNFRQIMRNSSLRIPRTWMAMLSGWCLRFFTDVVSERSSHVWCLEWSQELRWPTWLLSGHLGDGETWWQAREYYVTTLGMKSNKGPTGILLVMLTNIYWFREHIGNSSKNFTGRNSFNCHDNPIG